VFKGEFVFSADQVQQWIGKRVQDLQGKLYEAFRDHSAPAVFDPIHKGSDDCIVCMRLSPIEHAFQFNKLIVFIINHISICLFRLFYSFVSAFYEEHVFRREESHYRQLPSKVSTYRIEIIIYWSYTYNRVVLNIYRYIILLDR